MSDCKCTECKCGKDLIKEIIEQIEDTTLPFTEEWLDPGISIRHFTPDHPDHLFKWHYDPEDRLVTPIGETDWQFQFDNELPFIIKEEIYIPAEVYHRIIKGKGHLSLKIDRS
jgi:hypothetical protein